MKRRSQRNRIRVPVDPSPTSYEPPPAPEVPPVLDELAPAIDDDLGIVDAALEDEPDTRTDEEALYTND